jgi:hypothetical protein
MLELRACEGETREPVLRHFEAATGSPHVAPQRRHFSGREAGLMGNDEAGRGRQGPMQIADQLFF